MTAKEFHLSRTPIIVTMNDLEETARDARVFMSMPLIPGVTPKILLERGNREDLRSPEQLPRYCGFFQVSEIGLPVLDHGSLYGDAAFEGILVAGPRLFCWREHLNRLYESAERLRIQIPYTPVELTKRVLKVASALESPNQRTAYLRLVVTRGVGDLGINPAKCLGSTVYCIASTIQLYPESLYDRGISVAVARNKRRSSSSVLDPRIKSCDYLNNIAALIDTCDQETYEALMLSSDGFISEATTENVFGVIRSPGWENDPSRVRLYTPSTTCCLEGVTRGLVLRYALDLGFHVEESKTILPLDLIGLNREVFLTGTSVGIVPVISIDGQLVGDGMPGPITREFRSLLKRDVAKRARGLELTSNSDEILRYLGTPENEGTRTNFMPTDFVRTMFAIIDSREWDRLERLFDKEITYERPGYQPLVGRERVTKFYREERVIASGRHSLDRIVGDAENAACWGRFVGRHNDGSEINEGFADVYGFRSGKILTRRSYFFRPAI